MRTHLLVPVLTAILPSLALGVGQTITVTTASDIVDFAGPQTVAQLPGPDGVVSFREACIAANNTPGPQTIEFAIPLSEMWLTSDVMLLRVENSPGGFVLTDDGTTVDFTSQTRNIGDTNPSGNEVGIYSLMSNFTLPQGAITLAGNGCVVKGLDMVQNFGYAVLITGSNNRVIGCRIFEPFGGLVFAAVAIRPYDWTPAIGNIIGGTAPGEGNNLACYPGVGIEISGPVYDTVVVGNTLTRSHQAGVLVQAGASGTRIGGLTPQERNVIAGNGTGGNGIPQDRDVLLDTVSDTRIEGNYLGTTADGVGAALPPAVGIEMRDCDNTTIVNNVISGYLEEGIHEGRKFRSGIGILVTTNLDGPGTAYTTIQGNLLGVAAYGTSALPNAEGVRVAPLADQWVGVTIGGAGPGESNTIAHNAGAGVSVFSGAMGVTISGNSIFANGAPDALFPAEAPGIDLVGPSGMGGVTPNDPGDEDSGGNDLQNFPVLTSAGSTGSVTRIGGSLNSIAAASFRVEFFSSPACSGSGYGQGAAFVGATTVTTDGAGDASFQVNLPVGVTPGDAVTATATELSSGDTSEFSACLPVMSVCPADIDNNGFVNGEDFDTFACWFFYGQPAADFDANGFVNGEDFDGFSAAFFAGC